MSDCDCYGGDPPALSISEIKCGWPLEDFDSSFDPKITPIDHMRFHNWGSPYLLNMTYNRLGYTYCTRGAFIDTCVKWEDNESITYFTYIAGYSYSAENGCERVADVLSGSGALYRTIANCGGGELPYTDASGPAALSGLNKGISYTGTYNGDPRTDYWLSLPAFPASCGTNTDTRSLAKTVGPLGIRETFTRDSSSAATSPDCPDTTCLVDYDVVKGYDSPDDYRLQFSFTERNTYGANWCRVIATVFFTPWDIATEAWGAEVEVRDIDFKWKPQEDPHIESFEYTDLGKFRIGPVKVYLAGRGHPDVYTFEP